MHYGGEIMARSEHYTVSKPVDRLWRLIAESTLLGSRYRPTGNIKECYNSMFFMPIYTADADGPKLFCRVGVGGVNTNSQLVGDSFVVSSV